MRNKEAIDTALQAEYAIADGLREQRDKLEDELDTLLTIPWKDRIKYGGATRSTWDMEYKSLVARINGLNKQIKVIMRRCSALVEDGSFTTV